MQKPTKVYHGSTYKISGPLKPILRQDTPDHVHTKPSVFGTERADVAALFMFPLDILASIGFEKDVAYICIWGTDTEYTPKDREGFLYVLPTDTFEKVGKEYEWQSFTEVTPTEVQEFPSALKGMMDLGVQVYFINDEDIFDKVVADKDNRAPILKDLVSENQKQNINAKNFQ